jgi:hypothetical protein
VHTPSCTFKPSLLLLLLHWLLHHSTFELTLSLPMYASCQPMQQQRWQQQQLGGAGAVQPVPASPPYGEYCEGGGCCGAGGPGGAPGGPHKPPCMTRQQQQQQQTQQQTDTEMCQQVRGQASSTDASGAQPVTHAKIQLLTHLQHASCRSGWLVRHATALCVQNFS